MHIFYSSRFRWKNLLLKRHLSFHAFSVIVLFGFPPHEVIPMCVRLRKHRSGFCEVWDLGDRVETEPHMATCMRTLQLNTHRRVSLRATLQCDMRNMQKLKKANYLKNYYPHSKKNKKGTVYVFALSIFDFVVTIHTDDLKAVIVVKRIRY